MGLSLSLGMTIFCLPASQADQTPISTLSAIRLLSNDQASHRLPVRFEATVSFWRNYESLLFVQENGMGIFVQPPQSQGLLLSGDRVRIEGVTTNSFRPNIEASRITVLKHGPPPKPVHSDFDELIHAKHDATMVTVCAIIHAADLMIYQGRRSAILQLLADGGHIEAEINTEDIKALHALLDTTVDITGIAAGRFDSKMQQTGVALFVPGLSSIRVLTPATDSPDSLPLTAMDKVILVSHIHDLTPRVRVRGAITYYQPGTAVVLQDGSKSLWISTHTHQPLRIGDIAEATGFPSAKDRMLTLTDGDIQDMQLHAPVVPAPATSHQLSYWSSSEPIGHQNDLVSLEGQLIAAVREASQDEFVLLSDGRLFNAIYHHPIGDESPLPMPHISEGSKVRVTGVCIMSDASLVRTGQEVPFSLLLRSFNDLEVVAQPSWMNVRHLAYVLEILAGLCLLAALWLWSLHRKVRTQTGLIATKIAAEAERERRLAILEHRRSQILEEINGNHPLEKILDHITKMVSFELNGAACWCLLSNGTRAGSQPLGQNDLRTVQLTIPSHENSILGILAAALPKSGPEDTQEDAALNNGVRLAVVAVETRRVYADLHHRSEFDMLTDVHNRFSLRRRMDALIVEAEQQNRTFGLIYIDLDHFKEVNDQHGHHTGDLYLQEAARRMKQQLRSHDLLARMGGDEFAVLVPEIPGISGIEEISQRLEHCFDAPFYVNGIAIQGSASIGFALYPMDGQTRDSLMSTADAAMYAMKHLHHQKYAT